MRKLMKEVITKIGDNYIVETHYKDKKENICIKSKINKISDNKYELITYDNNNKSIKSNIIYNILFFQYYILLNNYQLIFLFVHYCK